MAYVELNGVRAGLYAKPSEYRWCSVGRFVQGGRKAAGVVFPRMASFDFLKPNQPGPSSISTDLNLSPQTWPRVRFRRFT